MPTCSAHRRRESPFILVPGDVLPGVCVATRCGTLQAVVVACISPSRRPLVMPIIDDCPSDRVGEVLRLVLRAITRDGRTGSLVLATSRPGTDPTPTAFERDLWPTFVREAAGAGWPLEEWYILADGRVAALSEVALPEVALPEVALPEVAADGLADQ